MNLVGDPLPSEFEAIEFQLGVCQLPQFPGGFWVCQPFVGFMVEFGNGRKVMARVLRRLGTRGAE